MKTQAVYYRNKNGVQPVADFIDGLADKPAAKIDDAVEEYLNDKDLAAPPPPDPYSSQIEGELRELRVRFGKTRYRILYQRSDNLIVLLNAFEKNTGKVPDAEKDTAKKRMADFKARMNAKPRVPPRAAGKDAPRRRRKKD